MNRSSQSSTATTASGPDVRQLETESLPTTTFPIPRTTAFRVHFDPLIYAAMKAHASENVSVEICGVLVGDLGRDADGPFVTVRNYIRCDSAAKKFAEVTFTHESWSHINKEMDTKFQDQRIVGWYHSHPNFGIFLSDRDLFIQQNFFSGPGQIALVIDPVRKIEGVFEWRNGNATPTVHYWVGEQIQLSPEGSGVTGMPEGPLGTPLAAEEIIRPGGGSSSNVGTLSPTLMIIAGLSLFLTGWLLASWRTDAERRALIAGTVARFGMWKVWKPDLDLELDEVERAMAIVTNNLRVLGTDHLRHVAKSDKDDSKAAQQTATDWKKTIEVSEILRQRLHHIKALYAMSPEERHEYQHFIDQLNIELAKGRPSPAVDAPPSDEKDAGQDKPVDEKQKGSKEE